MAKQSFHKQSDDEEYKPTRPVKTCSRKKKAQMVQDNMKNSSKWTLQQNQRFLEFVKLNREMLICPLRRKEQRVFLQLSRFIITRTPDQCRSHHQKMIKHHNDLDGIIQNLEKRLLIRLSPLEIEEEIQEVNQIIEKKEKDEEPFFSDTKIDIEMESDLSAEKDLWGILNEEIWIQRPIDILLDF